MDHHCRFAPGNGINELIVVLAQELLCYWSHSLTHSLTHPFLSFRMSSRPMDEQLRRDGQPQILFIVPRVYMDVLCVLFDVAWIQLLFLHQ